METSGAMVMLPKMLLTVRQEAEAETMDLNNVKYVAEVEQAAEVLPYEPG